MGTLIHIGCGRASRLMASAKIKARINEVRTAEYLPQPWSAEGYVPTWSSKAPRLPKLASMGRPSERCR